MVNYTEELFNAIKTISKKEVEALHFDTTIEVTVTDASRAHLGIYTVTNGSIYFTAYSKDTYKEKDRVLVMIPQGDYDQQKIIIGKKSHGDVDKPINYTEPFSQIIDITNNLVPKSIAEFGMVANGDDYKWENSDTSSFTGAENILNPTSLIWSAREYNDKFLEALESLNTILSEYRKENINQTYDNEYHNLINNYSPYDGEKFAWDDYFDDQYHFKGDENAIKSMREVILSSDNRFKEKKGLTRAGLRVDFKTLLKQFNTISGNYGLVLCIGFRDPDEYLNENNLLPSTVIQPFVFDSKDFFGNIYNFNAYYTQEVVFDISQYSNLNLSDIFLFAYQKNNFRDINNNLISSENRPNNIFINNYYICLGKDISEFNGDSLELYSLNETTFNKNSNTKEINLRWIHQDENSNIVKALDDNEIEGLTNYEVCWYRYNINALEIDSFAGARWERIKGESPPLSAYTLKADISKNSERILVIVVKNETELIAKSNILEFTNKNNVMSDQVIKDINALSIRYDDESQGNYFIYDSMQMAKNGEDEKIRKLTAVYAENIDEINNKPVLQDCESIKWIFPDSNSMIVPLDFNQNKIQFNNEANQSEVSNGDGLLDFTISHENNSYIITKNNLTNNSNIDRYTSIYYKINKNLNFNFGTNNVYLEVVKEGQTYRAMTTMQFDIAGTSGSKYTLAINWDNNNNMFDIKGTESLKGQMVLKSNDEEITPGDNANYLYSWYKITKENANLDISSEGNNNSIFTIKKTENSLLSINDLYILEVSLIGFENYNLIFRTPIPLTNLYKYDENDNKSQIWKINKLFGPTQVRYTTDNIVEYDKTPYSIELQRRTDDNNWITTNSNIDSLITSQLIPNVDEDDFNATVNFNLLNLNPDIGTITKRIKNFFIYDKQVDKEILSDRKKLFNRLIQTENLLNKSIQTLIDELNQSTNNDNENDLEKAATEFFKSYESRVNMKSLLLTFFKISLVSEDYPKQLTGLLKIEPWENYYTSTKLQPPSFYTSNLLQGIQFKYNGKTLLTYPIYVYQHNYPLSTLNYWDGQFKIDDKAGTIFSKGLLAGIKEDDNTFTGVILGDWKDSGVATSSNTGVYGFNHNIMTYALKDDGSAFFGNDNGKISLNNNNSINLLVEENNNRVEIKPGALIIQTREKATDQYQSLLEINKTNNKKIYLLQSYNFSDEKQTGMHFDLQNGKIKGYNFSLFSEKSTTTMDYKLKITDGSKEPFIQIGRKQKTNLFRNTLEEKEYQQIITAKEKRLNYIDNYYNKIIQAITLFNQLNLHSLILEEDSPLKNIFQNSDKEKTIFNNYPSLLNDTLPKMMKDPDLSSLLNWYNIKDLNNEDCSEWYFGVIPLNLLQTITIEQCIELLTALEISINLDKPDNIETKFSFVNFLIGKGLLADSYSSKDVVTTLITYLEGKKKNLYYPKIPISQLKKIPKMVNIFYNNEIKNYKDYLNKVNNSSSNATYNDIISLNWEAQQLINKYNILEFEERDTNSSIQNYTYKSYSIDGNEYNYIKIIEPADRPFLVDNINIENQGSSQSNCYYFGFSPSPKLGEISMNCNDDIAFTKAKDMDNTYVSKTFRPTEDLSNHVYIFYKATNAREVTQKTKPVYLKTQFQTIKNATLVKFYLFTNSTFDTDLIDFYISMNKLNTDDEPLWFGVKVVEEPEGIGLEKIQLKDSFILNNYATTLKTITEAFIQNNKLNNITTWIYDDLNNFYQTVKTPINHLIGEMNLSYNVTNINTASDIIYDSNLYKYYVKYNINENDDVFSDGYIKIPKQEIEYIYKYDNNLFAQVLDSDYIEENDYCLLKIRNNNNELIYYYVLLHNYKNNLNQIPISESESESESDKITSYFNFTTLGLNMLEEILQKKANDNDDDFIFSVKEWNNNLININKNGGYITSKDYKPTIVQSDATPRLPTANQENYTNDWSQGMKGFVIDLTNNRFFLGNNSSIQGVQTQYYPGQTEAEHRHFIISTGVNMSAGGNFRDRISSDNKWFILAQGGPTPGRGGSFRKLFGVDWNGTVWCRDIKYF